MRIFLGALASVLAALIIQGGAVYLASLLVEMPAVRTVSREEVAQAVAAGSNAAHLVTVLSYLLGGMAAVWIGALLGRATWPGWIGAGLLAAMGLVSAFLFPDPAWAQFGAPIAALVGGVLGRHIAPAPPVEDA
ncbi:MAG: hypothetical protein ACT4N8_14585 [Sphingosinicella sp.]|uniref:hypothetical protein n=1 Tax=Sphingosinicella sp. TaxID=1917971 RepID=UPI0040380238